MVPCTNAPTGLAVVTEREQNACRYIIQTAYCMQLTNCKNVTDKCSTKDKWNANFVSRKYFKNLF